MLRLTQLTFVAIQRAMKVQEQPIFIIFGGIIG
jgi:hypothetical protein